MFRVVGLFIVAALVAVGTLLVAPRTAFACTCYPAWTEYADEVAVAFTGRQIKAQLAPRLEETHPFSDLVVLVFEVERVYKGNVGSRFAVVSDQGTSCGVNLDEYGGAGRCSVWIGGPFSFGECV